MNKDHSAKQVAAQRKFEEWQKDINAKNFAQVSKLQTELSMLVKIKKMELLERDTRIEKQRSDYEIRINNLNAQIKSLTATGLNKDSIILELQTTLKRYQDIESQLFMARDN